MNLEIGSDRISNNFGLCWHTLDVMPGADIVHDLERFPYPIDSDKYNIIYMSHVLEHIRWTETEKVLNELYRILKPEGCLEIWVPDLDKLIKGYISEEIPEIWSIHNPERNYMKWFNGRMFSYGGPENLHKACFNYEYLALLLEKAGFVNIESLKKPRGVDHGYINLGIKGVK
jgi:predicted SAM-dependent methyltransferase